MELKARYLFHAAASCAVSLVLVVMLMPVVAVRIIQMS